MTIYLLYEVLRGVFLLPLFEVVNDEGVESLLLLVGLSCVCNSVLLARSLGDGVLLQRLCSLGAFQVEILVKVVCLLGDNSNES